MPHRDRPVAQSLPPTFGARVCPRPIVHFSGKNKPHGAHVLKLASLSLVALFALISPSYAEWPVATMNAAIDQTNFIVNKGCSGTLIDVKNKYILTAAHCVADQYETLEREVVGDDNKVKTEKYRRLIDGSVTQLEFSNNETVRTTIYRVSLKAVATDVDLAVVQVNGELPNAPAAVLADREPVRGEKVFVVGNPTGSLYSSVGAGLVASNDRTYGLLNLEEHPHGRLMQISSGVVGGNSGGAVYNEDGQLVGVPVLAHRTAESIGFAVPLDVIKAFLKDKQLDGTVKPPAEKPKADENDEH